MISDLPPSFAYWSTADGMTIFRHSTPPLDDEESPAWTDVISPPCPRQTPAARRQRPLARLGLRADEHGFPRAGVRG
jgi:hypothetical protein